MPFAVIHPLLKKSVLLFTLTSLYACTTLPAPDTMPPAVDHSPPAVETGGTPEPQAAQTLSKGERQQVSGARARTTTESSDIAASGHNNEARHEEVTTLEPASPAEPAVPAAAQVPLTVAEAVVSSPSPQPVVGVPAEFSLESLPLTIDDNWSMALNSPREGSQRCILESRAQPMDDGQGQTSVVIVVREDRLVIKTDANIDLSYPDDGIVIGEQGLIELDRIERERWAVIETGLEALYGSMRSADSMRVQLGFWPTWPRTQTHILDVDLSAFERGHQLLERCQLALAAD